MDFSHLHTYAPPQYVPENTGYTYSLSSSYSSAALDFETSHKLDPVFDSPKMSRRSLRLLSATAYSADGRGDFVSPRASYCQTFEDQLPKTTRQRKRKTASGASIASQDSLGIHTSDASSMNFISDESLIKEQTVVRHFWGLDDDGDPKGTQANGEVATAESQLALTNGYSDNNRSILSERKEVLTAFSAARMPPTRIYSRDRSQKHESGALAFYTSKILEAARYSATSVTSFLIQLFHVVLLKLGRDSKAYSNYYGSTNVKGILREDHQLGTNGDYVCDDCKGKKQLEVHTAVHTHSSRFKGVASTIWHIFSYTGYFVLHALQRTGTAGWLASKKFLSLLWLAVVSPGKVASRVLWWFGTAWYQLVTLFSLLDVFILTRSRCLPKLFKVFLYLLPFLLPLAMWYWGSEVLLSSLPAFNWSMIQNAYQNAYQGHSTPPILDPLFDSAAQPVHEPTESFDSWRVAVLEKQVAHLAEKWHNLEESLNQGLLHLEALQDQTAQLNDKNKAVTELRKMVDLLLQQQASTVKEPTESFDTSRVAVLEKQVASLTEALNQGLLLLQAHKDQTTQLNDQSKAVTELRKTVDWILQQQASTPSYSSMDHEMLTSELGKVVEKLSKRYDWLASQFASRGQDQNFLRDLERRILRKCPCHIGSQAGVSGITEEQARAIVNEKLKVYSEDKLGMPDFALESAGGSILNTRCSETYGTKTAIISLFGIPLWYFSQSPRTVIQPEIYPGTCWAFAGSQGHLVIRLAAKIRPTSFTLEHISKSLSPLGKIDSAPKDFSVYGLKDEHDEEGVLLGQFRYEEDGSSLQMFHVTAAVENKFQIVELKVLSNWGNTEYTCLYRFRVHGTVL